MTVTRNAEELASLKGLVSDSLAKKGVLGKLKAELRASVFSVFNEQNSLSRQPSIETATQKVLKSEEGAMMFSLVREFLDFFQLDYTLSVFGPEANLETHIERTKLANSLGLKSDDSKPLLMALMNQYQMQKQNETTAPVSNKNTMDSTPAYPLQDPNGRITPISVQITSTKPSTTTVTTTKQETPEEPKQLPTTTLPPAKLPPLSSAKLPPLQAETERKPVANVPTAAAVVSNPVSSPRNGGKSPFTEESPIEQWSPEDEIAGTNVNNVPTAISLIAKTSRPTESPTPRLFEETAPAAMNFQTESDFVTSDRSITPAHSDEFDFIENAELRH